MIPCVTAFYASGHVTNAAVSEGVNLLQAESQRAHARYTLHDSVM